jgi:hypothetical protein
MELVVAGYYWFLVTAATASLARTDPVQGKGVWSSAYTGVVSFPRIPGE